MTQLKTQSDNCCGAYKPWGKNAKEGEGAEHCSSVTSVHKHFLQRTCLMFIYNHLPVVGMYNRYTSLLKPFHIFGELLKFSK